MSPQFMPLTFRGVSGRPILRHGCSPCQGLAVDPDHQTPLTKFRADYLEHALIAALLFAFSGSASRAESLHRLSEAQIRSQFSGKTFTDDTHWRETYAAGGKLVMAEMGQAPPAGSWRIDGERLCRARPGVFSECYEVWGSGNTIELRHGNSVLLEGFLRPAAAR
jgi:hypothetical protein